MQDFIDHIQQRKIQEIRFTGQTSLFRKNFQTFNARAARSALFLNVLPFCKPKSSCFIRETVVKRISFFMEVLMLYVAYFAHFDFKKFPWESFVPEFVSLFSESL